MTTEGVGECEHEEKRCNFSTFPLFLSIAAKFMHFSTSILLLQTLDHRCLLAFGIFKASIMSNESVMEGPLEGKLLTGLFLIVFQSSCFYLSARFEGNEPPSIISFKWQIAFKSSHESEEKNSYVRYITKLLSRPSLIMKN